jgi:hypothetical protein
VIEKKGLDNVWWLGANGAENLELKQWFRFSDGGIPPHGDGKSVEERDKKRVRCRPLRKRVRKALKGKGLNQKTANLYEARALESRVNPRP